MYNVEITEYERRQILNGLLLLEKKIKKEFPEKTNKIESVRRTIDKIKNL